MKSRRRLQKKDIESSAPNLTHSFLQTRPFTSAIPKSDELKSGGGSNHVGFNLTNIPIQPKLTIGQPKDKYEQEADQVAQQVVQRIHSPQVQTDSLEEGVQRTVDATVLQKMKAEGEKAHLQDRMIQRFIAEQSEEGTTKYYSHPMPGQEITENQGVITVSTSDQDNGMGGHSTLFFEYWDTNTQSPKSIRSDLTLLGGNKSGAKKGAKGGDGDTSEAKQGAKKGDKSKINIRILDGTTETGEYCANLSNKRSWVASTDQIMAGIAKAEDIQANSNDYTYAYLGFGFTKKKPINCARFAEKVLKASGIKATSGLIVKTPYELATGSKTKKKKKKTKEQEPENIEVQEEAPLPEVIQEIKIGFVELYDDDNGHVGSRWPGLPRAGTEAGITAIEETVNGTDYTLLLVGKKLAWITNEHLQQFLPNAAPAQANGEAQVENDA